MNNSHEMQAIDAVKLLEACRSFVPSDVRLPAKVSYALGRNIARLKKCLKERDEALGILNESYNIQKLSAAEREAVLEEYKKEVKAINEKMVTFEAYRLQQSEIDSIEGISPESLSELVDVILTEG